MTSDRGPRRGTAARISLVALGLISLFFVSRIWSLDRPLVFEEGLFAELSVTRPSGPDYLLVARFDGRPVYGPVDHPAPMYEVLRSLGAAAGPWIRGDLPTETITPRLRLLYALVSLPVWLALGLISLRRSCPLPAVLLTAAVMASPIAVTTTTQLQIDGSVGVLFTGVVAIALLVTSSGTLSERNSRVLLAVAAAILSLGKQEWSLALAGAIGLAFVLAFVARRFGRTLPAPSRGTAMSLALGLILGNLLSFSIDPANYLGGLRVMTSIGRASTPLSGDGDALSRLLEHTRDRVRTLATPLVLAAITCVAAFPARRDSAAIEDRDASHRDANAILLALFGLCLFGGFLLSGWNAGDVRYFMPAAATLTAAVLALTASRHGATVRKVILAAAVLLSLHAAYSLVRAWHAPASAHALSDLPRAPDPRQVPVLPAGLAWNRRDVDFVSDAESVEHASRRAAEHGRTLWVPPAR